MPPVWASSLKVRIPVVSRVHGPEAKTHDFGSALLNTQPTAVFRFTNRGSEPTTVGAVAAIGKAVVVDDGCSGSALGPFEYCELSLGVNVTQLGANSGSVNVNHSSSSAPDVYVLTATGVMASANLRFDEPLIRFGQVTIQSGEVARRTATLRNVGQDVAYVDDVFFMPGSTVFRIVGHNCGELMPGDACR